MKTVDFPRSLANFLTKYLPGERGMSKNTIDSYRTTFILLISFMKEQKGIFPEKLVFNDLTKTIIESFLNYLENDRLCSASTRNVRLAALHSFFKYVQYEWPEHLDECRKILSIKVKKAKKGSMNYLTLEGIKLLLSQPDLSTSTGLRDLAMLALMYDTGCRVQEIIDLHPSSLRLNKPYTIKLVGKGNKARIVPLMENQVAHLKNYMSKNHLFEVYANMYPLFFNKRKEKLTRAGVTYILDKYLCMAKIQDSTLFQGKISCHSLRHSKAMHLLQAGVNLVYIRDILGHTSVTTTEIYARADSKQKREAIENAYVDLVDKEIPVWVDNENLLSWLKNL
ncbi:site-specific integrase [Pedobacter sp. ok626]|uniref:site-specific integrase n=1 Tax=Pedobacter sp. ok626 TaxID=1761882 RepID=UPI000AC0E2D6|nr:site-specific integrase [Pedobacter sp. ok626]